MKKNNKGFFLAEAIVMIGLIAVVMVTVYKNVGDLYKNFKYRTKYWDQPEDIYTLKEYENLLKSNIYVSETNKIGTVCPTTNPTCNVLEHITTSSDKLGEKVFSDLQPIYVNNSSQQYYPNSIFNTTNNAVDSSHYLLNYLDSLYIISYTKRPSTNIPDVKDFNIYLKRMKITTNDIDAYRLIGVFKYGSDYRFASIKVDNPKYY